MASPAQPYIPNFGYKPQAFTVHNPSPEAVNVRWAGLAFTVPPADTLSHKPGKYDDGGVIPGTLSLEDAYSFGPDGNLPNPGAPPNWFAAEAVRNMLGIDSQGIATSPYAKRGLSVLPPNPTREQVAEIAAAGMKRYHQFLVDWAQYTVMAWADSAERARRAGVAAVPPGRDYYKAEIIIKKHNEEMKKMLGYVPQQAEQEIADDDIEFQAYAIAEAMKIAKTVADDKNVSSAELAEKMIEDPKIRQQLMKKYRIRKVGHLDVPTVGAEGEDPQ